jgi:mandelate racemase
MDIETLTLRSLRARPVLLPMKRPVAARIARINEWPLILIDLETEEGVTGRSYLEPYVPKAMKYLVAALHDLGEMLAGHRVAPLEFYQAARRSLHFVGYSGISMIAASGLDMAAWDALARAADVPTAVLLGGSIGPVPAYNSNGLWLRPPDVVAEEAAALCEEGGFSALKLRVGRDRPADDLASIEAVRRAAGDEISLMIDFNQALHIGEALARCHALDDLDLAWIEEPIAYDDFGGYAKLTQDLKTPVQIGENFYGVRDLYRALQDKACDYVMPDFMRIGGVTGWIRAAGVCSAAAVPMSTHLYPEVGAHMMRATETAHWLEWQDWANPVLLQPYEVNSGQILIPERPGFGLDWDEDAVAKHLVG